MITTRRSVIQGLAAGAALSATPALASQVKGHTMNALSRLRRIDYTVIFARDLAAMKRFYAEVMEFELVRELGPSWIEFRLGENILALTEPGLLFDDAPPPAGALSVQLAFLVAPEDVAKCADELVAKGIVLDKPVTDQQWGHRTVFFRDPDGNVLEIYAEI